MDTKTFKPEDWMTATEAAEHLGISRQAVEAASIQTRNRAPRIRSVSKFRKVLYNRADVLAYTVRPKYRKEETK